ncbi:MAG: folylpolyglutamate synthase/dihydrofolate synthase family protein [Nitrospirota bacterium]
MTYDETIAYLYRLQKHGIKLGLHNTITLLSMLGNPQNSFRSIHIAGTNGKGSTSAMIAAMLQAAGQSVGLFTSPHLVSFTERIRVDSIEITEDDVVKLTNEIVESIEKSRESCVGRHHSELAWIVDRTPMDRRPNSELSPTFFEFVTAIAFLYFKRRDIDWAVVETGMGGRLDATNVLVPKVSVITRISYDHREFLGNTLQEIAAEKAGIIKQGIPVVSAAQAGEAMEVIRQKASELSAPLYVYREDFVSQAKEINMKGITLNYRGSQEFQNLYLPLCGDHQVENASIAIKAFELLMDALWTDSIRDGLASTRWPGRLELIKGGNEKYDILIDGAHNPDASDALADSLIKYFVPYYEKIILVLGIMSDKDSANIMRPLLPLASEIIFTAPDYERAALPNRLAETALSSGFHAEATGSVKEAIGLAIQKTDTCISGSGHKKSLILITGSFYTIGEAKAILGYETTSPSLSGLR